MKRPKKRKSNKNRVNNIRLTKKISTAKSSSGFLCKAKKIFFPAKGVISLLIALPSLYGAYSFYYADPKIEPVNDDADLTSPFSVPFNVIKPSNFFTMEVVKWDCNIVNAIPDFGYINDVSLTSYRPTIIETKKEFTCSITGNYKLPSAGLLVSINYRLSLGVIPLGHYNYTSKFKWNNGTKKWVPKSKFDE